MIKRIILILALLCAVVSCGKKADPVYKESKKKIEIKDVLKNKS